MTGRPHLRGRGYRLGGGIDLAQVRRPEDDLGQQPGQRPSFEVGDAALLGDGSSRYPPPPAGQVEDYVTRLGPGLDFCYEIRRRRGWG